MERRLHAHKARYATDEVGAVGRFRIPQGRGRLKMLDIGKDLLSVGLVQVNSIPCRQILFVQIAIARPGVVGATIHIAT